MSALLPDIEIGYVAAPSVAALACQGKDGCGAYVADADQHRSWHGALNALLVTIIDTMEKPS